MKTESHCDSDSDLKDWLRIFVFILKMHFLQISLQINKCCKRISYIQLRKFLITNSVTTFTEGKLKDEKFQKLFAIICAEIDRKSRKSKQISIPCFP